MIRTEQAAQALSPLLGSANSTAKQLTRTDGGFQSVLEAQSDLYKESARGASEALHLSEDIARDQAEKSETKQKTAGSADPEGLQNGAQAADGTDAVAPTEEDMLPSRAIGTEGHSDGEADPAEVEVSDATEVETDSLSLGWDTIEAEDVGAEHKVAQGDIPVSTGGSAEIPAENVLLDAAQENSVLEPVQSLDDAGALGLSQPIAQTVTGAVGGDAAGSSMLKAQAGSQGQSAPTGMPSEVKVAGQAAPSETALSSNMVSGLKTELPPVSAGQAAAAQVAMPSVANSAVVPLAASGGLERQLPESVRKPVAPAVAAVKQAAPPAAPFPDQISAQFNTQPASAPLAEPAHQLATQASMQATSTPLPVAPQFVAQPGLTRTATTAALQGASIGDGGAQAGLMFEQSARLVDPAMLPQMLAEASIRAGATGFRQEVPRLVATQLAEAVATRGQRRVDVVLSPRELGHVTMRLATTETGVVVSIQAERPETEELMRRHIHELEKEFREMGFSDIGFDFGGGSQQAAQDDGAEQGPRETAGLSGEAVDLDGTEQAELMLGQLNLAAEGLDVRV